MKLSKMSGYFRVIARVATGDLSQEKYPGDFGFGPIHRFYKTIKSGWSKSYVTNRDMAALGQLVQDGDDARYVFIIFQ